MMIKPRIETVREKADSRYTLVILAAKRARDLIAGKPALIEDDRQKPVSIAAYEIAEDLITYEPAPDNADDPADFVTYSYAGATEADLSQAEKEVAEEAAKEAAEEEGESESEEGSEEDSEEDSEENSEEGSEKETDA